MGPGGIAAGGRDVLDKFRAVLSKNKVKASLKEKCSSHKVGCMGLCARDVLVEIEKDGSKTVYQYVTPEMVERIVREHLIGGNRIAEWLVDEAYERFHAKQVKVVLEDCGKFDPEDIEAYQKAGGYTAARKALTSMTPEEVIEEIKTSGLRGRGGAGFPTGQKWEFGRRSPGSRKYIICNADEGDPGAFMDRAVIEGNPHAVIEGMIIGGYAIGASKGYVYIRAEYPLAVERLKLAIQQAHSAGYLGQKIFGSSFDFELIIKLGAGAFVCGEETALMASIEGLRGMPRAKPPFPAQKGLWGKPTIINNVETLANVPAIMRKGAKWFASFGTPQSKGTKVFALTGKVRNTGLIEVPMGITLREIIYDIGDGIVNDKELKAVQTGGPSGGCIPASQLDIKVDYESLARVGSIVGSGGMIVLDSDNCMVNIAKYFLNFTRLESCGKCVPCRIGTKRLLEILTRITEGKGMPGDIELLESLSHDVKNASLCGLGQTAPNPILSTLKYFRDEYEAHIRYKRCPSLACREIISSACQHTCPIGTEVSAYAALISQGRFDEAVQIIRKDNPLASVCARVCHHPCEAACKAGEGGGKPVAIRALKRFAMDYSLKKKLAAPVHREGLKDQKVAIVGSGPAGLTAAYFLSLKGYDVTVFEAKQVVGGMLRIAIPEYRLPKEVFSVDVALLESVGVKFRTGSALGKDFTIDRLFKNGYKAVFIAIGSHKSLRLGVPGEDLKGVVPSLTFLEAINTSKKIKTGKNIVVIGGGNSAVDSARTALRLEGTEKVTLVYRRTRAEMPAYEEEIEAAIEENIDMQFLTTPVEVLSRGGRVCGIKCIRMKLGEKDSSGRARPEPVEGSEFVIDADTILVAIGERPDTSCLKGNEDINVSEKSALVVDPETLATSRPGVFAGGDVVTGSNSVVNAMQAGKKAVESIDKYLRGEPLEIKYEVTRPSRYVPPVELSDAEIEELMTLERPEMPLLHVKNRKKNFREVELGLTEDVAMKEAKRCLRCELGTLDGQKALREMARGKN